MKTRAFLPVFFALVVAAASGCKSAYYGMWEKMGKHKRDLLRANVEDARDAQEEASEEFKDALDTLKELYAFDGGELEKGYRRFKASFDAIESRAEEVRERIESVEEIAADLFEEWEAEIEEISSASLRRRSRETLSETRVRYAELHRALARSEQKMQPAITPLKDQVLFLKHNLNAQAIGALKLEFDDIEQEIQALIADIDQSVAEANAFIAELPE